MTYEEACVKLNQSLREPFKNELAWVIANTTTRIVWLHGYLTADELEAYAVIMRALQNEAEKQPTDKEPRDGKTMLRRFF